MPKTPFSDHEEGTLIHPTTNLFSRYTAQIIKLDRLKIPLTTKRGIDCESGELFYFEA